MKQRRNRIAKSSEDTGKNKTKYTWEYEKWTPSTKKDLKVNVRNEYSREIRKLLESELSRNLIKGIDTWAVSDVRYYGPFLKWTEKEHR